MRLKLWDVWFIAPLRPESNGPVRRAWTPWGAARIARRRTAEAALDDVSYRWESRYAGWATYRRRHR